MNAELTPMQCLAAWLRPAVALDLMVQALSMSNSENEQDALAGQLMVRALHRHPACEFLKLRGDVISSAIEQIVGKSR